MPETRPNVLLVLADDLGFGDIGWYNGGLTETPALDRLFAEGVVLEQQYAASPVCAPSRAGLLTGRYPHRTGVVDTLEWWGLERLSLRERTLADHLRAAGYVTGLVGKWHLGSFDPGYHPLRRGFDESVCFRGGMHDYWAWRLEWGETIGRADGRYLTDVFTEEAVGFIERHAGEPFFLHLAYNAPHTPLQARAEDVARVESRGAPGGPALATLYAMVERMDAGIGRVLEALETAGIGDDTIVLVASDNGPDFRGDGLGSTRRYNCGWNGAKPDVLEGGIRVPGVVRWPAGLPGSRALAARIDFIDWLPTLLGLAGVEALADAPPRDGLDLGDLLRGAEAGSRRPGFWQYTRYRPMVDSNAAVRDGAWKLVRVWRSGSEANAAADDAWLEVAMDAPERFEQEGILTGSPPQPPLGPALPYLLFNLDADPGETVDLASREPERVRAMAAALERWFDDVEIERRRPESPVEQPDAEGDRP